MRAHLLYITSLFFFFIPAHAQHVLSGKTLNDRNGSPISGVSIYFNNTSIGTLSNETGDFTLPGAIEGELIISSVGFERIIYKVGKEELGKRSFTFRLQPKEAILQDIMIMPDATRKKYLQLFRENFLGITEEADNSKITNMGAIYFVKPPGDKNGIIALSDTPLHIINRELGYNIQFDLGEFYFNEKSGITSFYGFTRYDEMRNKRRWQKNRRRAYYGSTVHFFRSLISNRLAEEGYSIYKVQEDSIKQTGTSISIGSKTMSMAIPVKATDIVKKDSSSGMYAASWGKKLMVQYHKKPAGRDYLARKVMVSGALPNGFRSYLNTEEKAVLIDENGLLENPLVVFFSGFWIYEKAANLLPYNYIPEKED